MVQPKMVQTALIQTGGGSRPPFYLIAMQAFAEERENSKIFAAGYIFAARNDSIS
jgi:hypothetical protein